MKRDQKMWFTVLYLRIGGGDIGYISLYYVIVLLLSNTPVSNI